jgi:hypothetical protein
VSARGIETESEIPFAGLWDLLSPLLDLRDRCPAAQATALGQALALEASGTPARFAVPAALLGLLSAAAEDGPLLCLVDDVQWLDAPSVEAIVFAARRLQNEGIAMLLAARDAVAGGTGAGRQVDAAGVERLALGALDDPPPPSSCAARTAPGCPARSPPTWSTPPPATRSRCSSCRARSAATSWPGARRCRPSCRPACRSTRPSAGSSRGCRRTCAPRWSSPPPRAGART